MKISPWLLAFLFCTPIAAQQSPNILVIFSDDHTNQTIGAFGSKLVPTPNLDRLANEGIRFTNCFVTNSICAPSRAVLLTGKYSHLNGIIDNGAERWFDGGQQQVQKLLQQAGYQTAWIGKWHLQSLPQGFSYWKILPGQGQYYNPHFINMQNDTLQETGYVTDLITNHSTQWLEGRDKSKPFFMVVGEKATHRPWLPDVKDLGVYDDIDFPMPENFYDNYENRRAAAEQDMTIDKTMTLMSDLKVNINYNDFQYKRFTPEQYKIFKPYYDKITAEYTAIKDNAAALLRWKYQRYMKDYLMTARSMDRNIGDIMQYLQRNNLMDNTIIIYASDQGFYMGEHGWFDKRFMYEESLRTPFIMRMPGNTMQGHTIDNMVLNLDFAPTILAAAGIAVPQDMQGNAVQALFNPKSSFPWRKAMFYHYYEYPEPHRAAPHIGIRTDRYKLIRFYGPFDAWELYDLQQDKTEMHNLINDNKYKSVIVELKKELKTLASQYADAKATEILAAE